MWCLGREEITMSEPGPSTRYRGVALATMAAGVVLAPIMLFTADKSGFSVAVGGTGDTGHGLPRTAPAEVQRNSPLPIKDLEPGTATLDVYQSGLYQLTALTAPVAAGALGAPAAAGTPPPTFGRPVAGAPGRSGPSTAPTTTPSPSPTPSPAPGPSPAPTDPTETPGPDPTTDPRTTDPPTTDPPTTDEPTSDPPTSEPTTDAPATDTPASDGPTSGEATSPTTPPADTGQ